MASGAVSRDSPISTVPDFHSQTEGYRLILQPMSKAERLRAYLYSRQFFVLEEKPICEANRIYTVICAEFNGDKAAYDDYDIYAGRLDSTDPNACRLLKKQAGILLSMAEGCASKGDYSGQAKYIRLAERLIGDIKGGTSDGKRQGSI